MFQSHFDLSDVVSILAQCPDDNTFFILQEVNSQEYWIPSAKTTAKKSWLGMTKILQEEIKLPGKVNKICKISRVWRSYSQEMLNHVVFYVTVPKASKQNLSAPAGTKPLWMTANDLQINYQKLKSPELLDILSAAQGTSCQRPKQIAQRLKLGTQPSWTSIIGDDPVSPAREILEQHVISEDPTHRKIMEDAGFTDAAQISIYSYFLVATFPCTYMNSRIFNSVFERFGWERNYLPRLFITADLDCKGFLSYRDFLYMVAVADPNMKHGASEVRSKYIFRFYDVNNDKVLDYNEVKALHQDIKTSKTKTPEAALLSKDADSCAKALGIEPRQGTDADKFAKALAQPRLKGTTVLLRSAKSATAVVPAVEARAFKAPASFSPAPAAPTAALSPAALAALAGQAVRKPPQDYTVAVHCITLKKHGTVIDKIWNVEGSMSNTSLSLSKTQLSNSPSMESFNQNQVHFEVLRGLEYFEKEVTPNEASLKPGRKPKAAYNWGLVDPTGFARCVMKVCEKVTPILKAEARLLELSSPCYVLGDMHGSFTDLMRFEKALWPLGPTLSPTTLLVLGDYVDRGPHSVELIAYLFAYKLQSPQKLMLIRGNHEIRAVQKMFTFHKECCHKFGDKLGTDVWEAVNVAMDCLPLAAVIDGKVFCTHGGIPPPWLCPTMAAINTVPCPLPRPDEQSPLAWDLMWNDPVNAKEVTPSLQMELNANEGFAVNVRRGTGHVFTLEALTTFLRVNMLSTVLRAHQMQEKGFFVQMRHRMETVFSASHYGKADNEAACVLVDSGRLRAFRVEMAD